ncbi:MAG: hypothetical protein AAGI52_12860 [Bacteroidota bacterium]
MSDTVLLVLAVLAALVLLFGRHFFFALPAWVAARREGADVGLRTLAGYSYSKARPLRLVRSQARLRAAGLEAELGDLAVLEVARVDTSEFASTVEARASRGLPTDLYELSAVALEGKLDRHGLAKNPVQSLLADPDRATPEAG